MKLNKFCREKRLRRSGSVNTFTFPNCSTHLAAYCANQGVAVMLGDVDRQQSAQGWLKLRRAQALTERAPIVGWTVDPKNTLRPPAGIARVVLDTPGGMRGFDLARVVMFADAILIPVCNSVFDRNSAAECYAELLTLPRVASGRCKVAAVGMRLDARTKAADVLRVWADGIKLPFIGVLRETQAYVRCIEQGLTLFDLPAAQQQADMAQWKGILEWLEPVWSAVEIKSTAKAGPRKSASTPARAKPVAAVRRAAPPTPPARSEKLFGWLPIPRFLQRKSTRAHAVSSTPWVDTASAR